MQTFQKLLLTLLIAICTIPLMAQGTISGTIIDEEIGETLIGAYVYLEGTDQVAVTDFDGKYQLEAAAGIYTVKVTYIGFADKLITDVEVVDKETKFLDVPMSSGAVEIEEVVVTAKIIERSENAVLLLQKNSDKIQDGISSQEMSKFSLGNAASAMTKVSGATVSGGKYIYIRGLGDRYSLTQLNGLTIPSADPYRNSAQLDLIPTNLLDNIITSKTFTPDQPGTFTGGNVDIKTKSFPEQFFLSVKVSTAFNNQNNLNDQFLTYDGGATDYWGFDDGTRARPSILDADATRAILDFDRNIPRIARNSLFYNAFLGDSGLFNSQKDFANSADALTKAFSQNFDVQNKRSSLDHGYGISFGNQYDLGENKLGVTFSAGFNTRYSHLNEYDKANWVLRFTTDDFLENQGDFKETLSTESPTVNGMLGLSYKIGNFNTINFTGIYNHASEIGARYLYGSRPDNILKPRVFEGRSLTFNERALTNFQLGGEHVLSEMNKAMISWKVSKANSSLNTPDLRFFENDWNSDTDVYEIPSSDVRRPFHFYRNLEDEQLDAKLDLTIPFSSKGAKVKVGALFTQKDRVFTEERYLVEQHDGYTSVFSGNPDAYLADDNYGLISSDDVANEYILANYIIDETIFKNSYTGNDDVFGTYAMVNYPITPKLKFIGGARYETTRLNATSRDTSIAAGEIEVNDILPSVNFVYALNDDMNLRASFSKTLSRPNMREIAPFDSEDVLEKLTLFGNRDLQKTDILNYDLRWEWFNKPGEIIALSSYYKDFTNPIVLSYRKSPNPEIEFVNVEKARLFGLELEYRKSLDFISPILKNVKFVSNLSYINSSMEAYVIPGLEGLDPERRPFEGQSPFVINAGLIYSDIDRGIDATLSLNTIGDRLNIIGREGTPDIYDQGRSQLDFTFSKKFKTFDLGFTANNLLNSDFQRSSSYLGDDYVFFNYKRGITFGLSLSYTIK